MTLDEVSELVEIIKNYDIKPVNERIKYLEWLLDSQDNEELFNELVLLQDFKRAYDTFNYNEEE